MYTYKLAYMKYFFNYICILLILYSCSLVEVARKTGKVIKSIDTSLKKEDVSEEIKKVDDEIKKGEEKIEKQKKYVEISLLGKDKAQIISKLGKPSLIRKNISTYSMRFDKKNCITYVFFNTKQQNPLVQYFELRDNNGNVLINKKDINNCF